MNEKKKTPKLSEEVKKRDADKFCTPIEWMTITDANGKEIKKDFKKKS